MALMVKKDKLFTEDVDTSFVYQLDKDKDGHLGFSELHQFMRGAADSFAKKNDMESKINKTNFHALLKKAYKLTNNVTCVDGEVTKTYDEVQACKGNCTLLNCKKGLKQYINDDEVTARRIIALQSSNVLLTFIFNIMISILFVLPAFVLPSLIGRALLELALLTMLHLAACIILVLQVISNRQAINGQ